MDVACQGRLSGPSPESPETPTDDAGQTTAEKGRHDDRLFRGQCDPEYAVALQSEDSPDHASGMGWGPSAFRIAGPHRSETAPTVARRCRSERDRRTEAETRGGFRSELPD